MAINRLNPVQQAAYFLKKIKSEKKMNEVKKGTVKIATDQ